MFYEMDSITKSMGRGEASDRVANQIITKIDGSGARKNVLVIRATNGPDVLDPISLHSLAGPGESDFSN